MCSSGITALRTTIYRAAFAHTAVVTSAADVMVDVRNHVWDLAPSQVLAEEADDRYVIIRDFVSPEGRILSAIFGGGRRWRASASCSGAPTRAS